MSRTSPLPKRLQPMLATLTDAPFDHLGWVFEDKYDGLYEASRVKKFSRKNIVSRGSRRVSAVLH
jgi:bifunctional non-homologous end joining protein LigD